MSEFLWRIARVARLRFFYQAARGRTSVVTALYVLVAGFISLSTLGVAAYVLDWPLIFPVLGPTAFLIFYSPARTMAWPRNCLLGHLTALLCGVLIHLILVYFFPGALFGGKLTLVEVIGASAAMALSALIMVFARILHPPAASTAMMAATGYFTSVDRVLGLALSLVVLSLEGVLLHRIAGVEYPWWREPNEEEDLPIRTKLGELTPPPAEDPYRRMAHRLATRRD